MSPDTFDLSEIRFVKRIVVGSETPNAMKSEAEIETAVALLNRCLSDAPRGRLIATERSFSLLNIGEHQVVLQHVTYHVGWARKPGW
ncbi:MAG: hypothetical protein EON88_01750, partial [Brevundimonas sp.]